MCSVVGYVGNNYSRIFVLEGLTRLEYRGYDSAGFACIDQDTQQVKYAKSQGDVSNLVRVIETDPIDGRIGLGHTRWSTHGVVSTENAHPHFDCHKKISVVHNGIIENHHELRTQLIQEGHSFWSQTDTEVIAHLLESFLARSLSLPLAVLELVQTLEGAYAFGVMVSGYPDTLIVARKRSPLCLGKGDDEIYVASDLLAFGGKTDQVFFMPDESFAMLTKDSVRLYDFAGTALPVEFETVSIPAGTDLKQGFEHFMLKEIYDQKKVIQDTVRAYRASADTLWSDMGVSSQHIKDLTDITFVGCGTSWHAALVAQFFFEEIAGIKVEVGLASEIRYRTFFSSPTGIGIAISQSGETADTLEALRFLKAQNMHTIALVNVASSSMVRETDGYLPLYAGTEVAVASTKAFTAQVAALYWIAHRMAYERGRIDESALTAAEENLFVVAEILEHCIDTYKKIIQEQYAPAYAQYSHALFLGRHISYPFAREASLKLKEISYIFTDCYPAAELKHGPLALVDARVPTFVFSVLDEQLYHKLVANVQEVKARKGHVVAFAFEGQKELIDLADTSCVIPQVDRLLGPLAMTGLMQFFVYSIAKHLGRPIDKPRNLAKSLTVE
jgi:glucosamine--fructose-6-phosphate aminotransferase (isomerizing)